MRQTEFTRRGVLVGMLGGSGALLLAACGQATMTGEPDADMAEKPAAEAKPAEMETVLLNAICYTEAQGGDYQRCIDGYHQEVGAELDLSIDITAWGEYWPKLKTSAAAGTPFDVMIMNGPNIMFHAANNILFDLSPYVKADNIDMTGDVPRVSRERLYTVRQGLGSAQLPRHHRHVLQPRAFGRGRTGASRQWAGRLMTGWRCRRSSRSARAKRRSAGVPTSARLGTDRRLQLRPGEWRRNPEQREDGVPLWSKPEGLEAFNFMHGLIHQHGVAPTRSGSLRFAGGKRNMFHNGLIYVPRQRTRGNSVISTPLDHINWGVQVPAHERPAGQRGTRLLILGGRPAWKRRTTRGNLSSTPPRRTPAKTPLPSSPCPAVGRAPAIGPPITTFPELAQKFLDSMDWGYDYPQSYSTLEWNSAIPAELNKAVDNEVTMDEAVATGRRHRQQDSGRGAGRAQALGRYQLAADLHLR